MNNTDLKLFQGNEEFDIALMRSILVFGEFGQSDRNAEMMPQVVLSFIIMEKGDATLQSIQHLFNTHFNSNYSLSSFRKIVNKLIENELIKEVKGNLIPIIDSSKGSDFFTRLTSDTEELINGVLYRYGKFAGIKAPYPQEIRRNVINALSVYLTLTGMQIINNTELPSVSDKSIKAAVLGVDNNTAIRIIEAIADTIKSPTDSERNCLNRWARANILTQALKLDPTLANFKANIIKQKTFVLDTDIVLHLLCTHASHSAEYHTLINKLREIGCQIYIPESVKKEVEGSAKQAISIAQKYGAEQLDEFTDYQLRGSRSNVFIEDFVNKRRQNSTLKKMNFSTYIGNIWYANHPKVLQHNLEKAIGKENAELKLEDVDLDIKLKEELKAKLKEEAENTAKGAERSYNTNEILSDTDARIYLTLKTLNEGIKGKGLLKYKFYLLTRSHRTVKVAQEKGIYDEDIICRPDTVSAVLEEIGYIPKGDISLINIFDNPFLVHAADAVWNRINPILEKGFQVTFMEFQRLEEDVEMRFDEFLLTDDPTQRINYAKKYRDLGYPFAQDYADMAEENQLLKEDNKQIPLLKERLKKQKKENAYLKKVKSKTSKRKSLKRRKKQ